MSAIKGKKVMLFLTDAAVGDGTICLATGFTFTYTVQMTDPQTKDDGDYQVPDPDGDKWEISHNSQSDISLDTISGLVEDYNNITQFPVKIAQASNWNAEGLDGLQSGGWEPDDTIPSVTGEVVISSLNLDGNVNDKSTIAATFTGRTDVTVTTPVNNNNN